MLEFDIKNRLRALSALRCHGYEPRCEAGHITVDAPSDHRTHLSAMAGYPVRCTGPASTRVPNRSASKAEKLADSKIDAVRAKLSSRALAYAEENKLFEKYRPLLIQRYELILAKLGAQVGNEDTSVGDVTGSKARVDANIAALNLAASKAPGEALTDGERRTLLKYTGFGGLTPTEDYYTGDGEALLPRIADRMPEGVRYDTFGLINEFYTPSRIAEDVWKEARRFIKEFRGADGRIRALEPSAGIGRFVEPTVGEKIDWTLVELSAVSGLISQRLYPNADFFPVSFQEASSENDEVWKRHFNLIVANPPYGTAGRYITKDKISAANREFGKHAYLYFVTRCADLLAKDGLMIQLIPESFLNSTTSVHRRARIALLRQAHMLGAYFMPTDIFTGSGSPTVLIFCRGRGGMLAEPPADDQYIVDGNYFDKHPENILGKLIVDPDAFRYPRRVEGKYTGLPPLKPRAICEGCMIDDAPVEPKKKRRKSSKKKTKDATQAEAVGEVIDEMDATAWVLRAMTLGDRYIRYRNRIKIGSDVALDEARAQYGELKADIDEWLKAPESTLSTRQLAFNASLGEESAKLARKWKDAGKVADFDPPPDRKRLAVAATTAALASQMYRASSTLTLGKLADACADANLPEPRIEELINAGFAVDTSPLASKESASKLDDDMSRLAKALHPNEREFRVLPFVDYLSGSDLWDKYDATKVTMETASLSPETLAGLATQASKIMTAIDPATIEEVSVFDPRESWVPTALIKAWYSERRRGWAYEYEPDDGYEYRNIQAMTVAGMRIWYAPYAGKIERGDRCILGFLNSDKKMWNPYTPEGGTSKQKQVLGLIDMYQEDFRDWLMSEEERGRAFMNAYNRSQRGFHHADYSDEMPYIERWSDEITLRPHQAEGANRVIAQHGGLLAFDVGVGKTFTAAGAIALMRQRGKRRPYMVLPNSLLYKWKEDISDCLPDYNVVLIGISVRKGRGGKVIVETDSEEQRIQKHTDYKNGLYDIAFVAKSTFANTPLGYVEEAYLEHVVEMFVGVRRENLEAMGKLTEKKARALKAETEGWHAKFGERLLPSKGSTFDKGPTFAELKVDIFAADEAHDYKNLHMAPTTTYHSSAKFMGGTGIGSKVAFQFDARAFACRANNGAVILLTATPAKNSPLELYNLLQYINPDWFIERGIKTPARFVERYLSLREVTSLNAKGEVVKTLALDGFTALPSLREFLFRYADFRNAESVNLDVPEGVLHKEYVKRSDAQAKKIAAWRNWISAIKASTRPEDEDLAKAAAMVSLSRQQDASVHPYICPDPEVGNYGSADDDTDEAKAASAQSKTLAATRKAIKNGEVDWRDSAKLAACVRHVGKNQADCGHIIFCDVVAAHPIIRQGLIDSGVPAKRIQLVNAATLKDAKARQDVVDKFNGKPKEGMKPQLDVLICNSVAEQGLDIQVRTCSIHHLDLPWTPASLQQRNGRGIRQGNNWAKNKNGNKLPIYYWLTERSADGYRLDTLRGKSNWLDQIVYSDATEVNNPAGSGELGQMAIILATVEDPEEAAALMEEYKQQLETQARAESRRKATLLWEQAVGFARYARRESDPIRAAVVRGKAEDRLAQLAKFDESIWPHKAQHKHVFERDVSVPSGAMGIVVAPGQWVKRGVHVNAVVTHDKEIYDLNDWKMSSVLSCALTPFPKTSDDRIYIEKIVDGKPVARPMNTLRAYVVDTPDAAQRSALRTIETYLEDPMIVVSEPVNEDAFTEKQLGVERDYEATHKLHSLKNLSQSTWDKIMQDIGSDRVTKIMADMIHSSMRYQTQGPQQGLAIPAVYEGELVLLVKAPDAATLNKNPVFGAQLAVNTSPPSGSENFTVLRDRGMEEASYYRRGDPKNYWFPWHTRLRETVKDEIRGVDKLAPLDFTDPNVLVKLPQPEDVEILLPTASGYERFLSVLVGADDRFTRSVLQKVSRTWFGLSIPASAWTDGDESVVKSAEVDAAE